MPTTITKVRLANPTHTMPIPPSEVADGSGVTMLGPGIVVGVNLRASWARRAVRRGDLEVVVDPAPPAVVPPAVAPSHSAAPTVATVPQPVFDRDFKFKPSKE